MFIQKRKLTRGGRWLARLALFGVVFLAPSALAEIDDTVDDASGGMAEATLMGDSPAGAMAVGRVGGSDLRDFFSFNQTQAADIAVMLTADAKILWLYVFDESGSVLGRTRNTPNAINPISLSLQPGTYYVKVERIHEGAGDYELLVDDAAAVASAMAAAGAADDIDVEPKESDVEAAPSLVESSSNEVTLTPAQQRRQTRRHRAAARRQAAQLRRKMRVLRRQTGDGDPVPATFKVFDRINFEGKPDLVQELNMDRLQFVGVSDLWEKSESHEEPNLDLCRKIAKDLNPKYPVCIDIEHWPTALVDDETAEESIDKLIEVAMAFKEVNPELKIGFYRMLPVRDYFTPVNHPEGSGRWLRWQERNARLSRLADHVDIIFPSLYVFRPDFNADGTPNHGELGRYNRYARANIEEARQYGKPVYAFLYPYYAPGAGYWSEQPISQPFFKSILESVTRHADGLVIWTPHYGRERGWDSGRGWWQATDQFIKRREISRLASFD